MMDEILFEVHHKGFFVRDPTLRYIMGKKKYFVLDIDKLGYMEIKSFVEDELGYKNVIKIHWCLARRSLHNELRLVVDDNSTRDMLNVMHQFETDQTVELYLEHELGESSNAFSDDSQVPVDFPCDEVEHNITYDDYTIDDVVEGEDNTVYHEDDQVVEVPVDSDGEARSIDVSDDELKDVRIEQYEERKGKKKKKKPTEEESLL
ncbi:hypothetical protein FRX31_009885, partial [Thalictrum thalictroides]